MTAMLLHAPPPQVCPAGHTTPKQSRASDNVAVAFLPGLIQTATSSATSFPFEVPLASIVATNGRLAVGIRICHSMAARVPLLCGSMKVFMSVGRPVAVTMTFTAGI
jgi:hypothetical protein